MAFPETTVEVLDASLWYLAKNHREDAWRSWYGLGVHVVDFADLDGPTQNITRGLGMPAARRRWWWSAAGEGQQLERRQGSRAAKDEVASVGLGAKQGRQSSGVERYCEGNCVEV